MGTIGIIGSGIMGAGIAQVAASRGETVYLLDVQPDIARHAVQGVRKRLDRLVEKKQLDAAQQAGIIEKLHAAAGPEDLRDADLVIEAVVEKREVKTEAFRRLLPHLGQDAILASNTSSLSITDMGRALGESRRFVGMHFFNPVPLMPLVEVIHTEESEARFVDRVADRARSWGKTVVRAKDTPGFIVNRVARGFYLEALRILGDGFAPLDQIDRTMRELGGFRMGPFELMDTIGIDVNYSVSVSVWEQLGKPARLTPHPIQQQLFERGDLGRKTQRGFFNYSTEPPAILVHPDPKPLQLAQETQSLVDRFVEKAGLRVGSPLENYLFARILSAILHEAVLAREEQVASAADIDTAMRQGTNYPRGPLEWAEQVGRPLREQLFQALHLP